MLGCYRLAGINLIIWFVSRLPLATSNWLSTGCDTHAASVRRENLAERKPRGHRLDNDLITVMSHYSNNNKTTLPLNNTPSYTPSYTTMLVFEDRAVIILNDKVILTFQLLYAMVLSLTSGPVFTKLFRFRIKIRLKFQNE